MKVSLIGLGIMGQGMAQNLLSNQVDLTVYNRSTPPVNVMERAGAKAAPSVSDAVADADVVITMLSNPAVVQTVMTDDILRQMPQGAIWIDSTTVDPAFSRECAQRTASFPIHYLEAPVTGTKPHAENAQLTYFIGGPEDLLVKVRPILEMMSQKILHLGDYGSAASFKLIVNGMLAQSMLVFAEALLMGEKMGLDREFLINTLPNLVVAAPFTKMKAEMVRNHDYPTQFPLEHIQKDLHLLAKAGYEYNQPLMLTNLAKEMYSRAMTAGYSRSDFAAVIESMH